MSPAPIRKLWFDRATKTALNEYAWAHRTSMARVVTAALEDVRDNPDDHASLADTDRDRAEVQLSMKIPDALWFGAQDSASTTGHSFASLVRRRIIKLLQDEGLLS